jgi:hypothetical protein
MAQFPAHVTNLLYTVTSYLVTGLRISVGTWTTYLSLLLKFLGGPVLCGWAAYALVWDAFSVQSSRRRWARFVSLNDVTRLTLLSTKMKLFFDIYDAQQAFIEFVITKNHAFTIGEEAEFQRFLSKLHNHSTRLWGLLVSKTESWKPMSRWGKLFWRRSVTKKLP